MTKFEPSIPLSLGLGLPKFASDLDDETPKAVFLSQNSRESGSTGLNIQLLSPVPILPWRPVNVLETHRY
jgi:hypothetical protein